jgi:hypothetical protein
LSSEGKGGKNEGGMKNENWLPPWSATARPQRCENADERGMAATIEIITALHSLAGALQNAKRQP